MKIIKEWNVLDCRTDPAQCYRLRICRRNDLAIVVVKTVTEFPFNNAEAAVFKNTTLAAMPEMTVETADQYTRQFVDRLEKHSCVVCDIPVASSEKA